MKTYEMLKLIRWPKDTNEENVSKFLCTKKF